MVKLVEPNGPSYGLLKPYDVILFINGINVEHAPQDQVTKMVRLCDQEIDITVRRATYEEQIRATNRTDPRFYMFNKSATSNNQLQMNFPDSLNSTQMRNHGLPLQKLIEPTSCHSPLNKLVTSISQQQPRPQYLTPILNGVQPLDTARQFQSQNYLTLQPDRSKNILKQRVDDQANNFSADKNNNNTVNGTSTLGRNGYNKFGRHSPLPPRCKSSVDDAQLGKSSRKTNDNGDDQPLLRRCNTMRLPPKVVEIFQQVIKIFFEDGRRKMLQFNKNTTVGNILENLSASMGCSEQIKSYFGLAVTVESDDNSKEFQVTTKKPFHVLDEDHPIMGISKLPYAKELIVLYRMIYLPSNIAELYNQDKMAFDYLYKQSCNDLRLERFSPSLDADIGIKLSALFLLEYVHSNLPKALGNNKDPKMYVRLVEKELGLEHFVPRSMVKMTKDKKGERIKHQYKRLKTRLLEQLKKNFDEIDFEPMNAKTMVNSNRYTTNSFHDLSLSESQIPLSDQIKMVFLNILKGMPCYKNIKRELPARSSVSPIDRNSVGDCSSSMESVQRTSDSSPLIRQTRNGQNGYPMSTGRLDQPNMNEMTRFAQMNSVRSLSSLQPPSSNGTLNGGQPFLDRPDIAQTPSIESISSITFNMHSTPSPQQVTANNHSKHNLESVSYPIDQVAMSKQPVLVEPSPMPRQTAQHQVPRTDRYNSIEKLYGQRYMNNDRTIDELLKTAVILPPPPPVIGTIYHELPRNRSGRDHLAQRQSVYLTPVLTERDLEDLRVPPPPKLN